jgi:hypothetical protein
VYGQLKAADSALPCQTQQAADLVKAERHRLRQKKSSRFSAAANVSICGEPVDWWTSIQCNREININELRNVLDKQGCKDIAGTKAGGGSPHGGLEDTHTEREELYLPPLVSKIFKLYGNNLTGGTYFEFIFCPNCGSRLRGN